MKTVPGTSPQKLSRRPPEPRRPDNADRSQMTLMAVQTNRRRFRRTGPGPGPRFES